MSIEALHLKIIDFNPLPEQSHLEAYWKVFHNGLPLEEIPDRELDEFLIQFKSQDDLVKIEVWASHEDSKFL